MSRVIFIDYNDISRTLDSFDTLLELSQSKRTSTSSSSGFSWTIIKVQINKNLIHNKQYK